MFNFFKKKQEIKKTVKKEKKGTPFNIKDHKANLQALYDCSVQRTAKDFVIQQVAVDGGTINVAMDSIDGCDAKTFQKAYDPNFVGEEIIFTHFAANGFIGFNNCSILAQDWLINKCLALPCDDAISINYDLLLKEDDVTDEDKDIIEKLKNLSGDDGKYKIKSICKKFAENKRKYGQALCIPLVKDADYSVPFNIDAITSKSYKGMVVIEPIWVAPVLDIEATTNPASERFYRPTWFRLPDGTLVHYTWFIFNTYGEVPDILKATYYFGGYPLPQQLYQYIYAAHKTAKEAPMLAQSKRLNYLEGNLQTFLNNEEEMTKHLNALSWMRNNWGWLFVKRDQKLGQIDTTLTDFDAVVMLGYQIVSAISWVPSARLLETSPKGWQSTGSYEDRNYSKLQQSIQRQDYCPILDFHYRLLAKSEFDLDKHYITNFAPIDTPTEKERAEIKELNSRTDMNYINAGVISPDEVRSVLREDVNSGYNTLPEEMEGEGENEENDPFANLLGGSKTPQNPFSMDKEPDDWFTSKGSHIPIQEGESKEEAFQKHIRKNRKEQKKDNNKTESTLETKTFKNGNEANTYFYTDYNYQKWSLQLSNEEKEIIADYSGDRYSDINEYLRNGDTSDENYSKRGIQTLDNVIDKFELKDPITVYRAISPAIAEKIKNTYTDKAFQSTTVDPNMLKNDTNRNNKSLLILNIPKGKGRGAYINEHSLYQDKEHEFLLKRNSTFKVRKRETKNGKTIITMDLIED